MLVWEGCLFVYDDWFHSHHHHHQLLALSFLTLLLYLMFWDTDTGNVNFFIDIPTSLNFSPDCWLSPTPSQLSYLDAYFIHLLPLSLVYQLPHYLWVLILSCELKGVSEWIAFFQVLCFSLLFWATFGICMSFSFYFSLFLTCFILCKSLYRVLLSLGFIFPII